MIANFRNTWFPRWAMDAGKTDKNGGVGREGCEGKSNLFSDWPSKSRAKAGLFRSQGVQIETDKIDIIRGMIDTQISSCMMCKRKPSLCIDHRHNACIKERADKGRGMQLNWLDYGTVRWNLIYNVHGLLHMVWEGDIRAVLQKWTRVILHAQLFSDMILTNSVLSKSVAWCREKLFRRKFIVMMLKIDVSQLKFIV